VDRGIWVTGTGVASGPRDECLLTVGSEVRAGTAAQALAESSAALERMRGVLLRAGVPGAAMTTSAVSLTPAYDQYPTVAGFHASVQLTASTRDLAGSGALLSDLVVAGGDAARVHQVTFRHADQAALAAHARDAAWADALARAEQLATLAGRQLGEVVSIDESESRGRPPIPGRMVAAAAEAGPTAVPLDAGEGAVVVSLTVGWALL